MLTRLADGSVMKGGKRRANRREVNIYAEFAKQSTRRARARKKIKKREREIRIIDRR